MATLDSHRILSAVKRSLLPFAWTSEMERPALESFFRLGPTVVCRGQC